MDGADKGHNQSIRSRCACVLRVRMGMVGWIALSSRRQFIPGRMG